MSSKMLITNESKFSIIKKLLLLIRMLILMIVSLDGALNKGHYSTISSLPLINLVDNKCERCKYQNFDEKK